MKYPKGYRPLPVNLNVYNNPHATNTGRAKSAIHMLFSDCSGYLPATKQHAENSLSAVYYLVARLFYYASIYLYFTFGSGGELQDADSR